MEDALWRRLLAGFIGLGLVAGGSYLGAKLGGGIAEVLVTAIAEGPPNPAVVQLGNKFGFAFGIIALGLFTWFFVVVPILRRTGLVSEKTIQRMSRWGQGS